MKDEFDGFIGHGGDVDNDWNWVVDEVSEENWGGV